MTTKIRYNIIIPLNRNDGTAQPGGLIHQTMDELVNACGGVSHHTETIHGVWAYENNIFRDHNNVLVVDVDDTPDMLDFFKMLKTILEERFEQTTVYIIRHKIEIL